jgi:hypothetical protein
MAGIFAGLLLGVVGGYVTGAKRNAEAYSQFANRAEQDNTLFREFANGVIEQAQNETDQLRHQNRVLVSRLASLTTTGAAVDPQAAIAAQEHFEPQKPLPPHLQAVINQILDPETRGMVEADALRLFNEDGLTGEEIEDMLIEGAE